MSTPVNILTRLDEMLVATRAALAASDLSDKHLVTVTDDGNDVAIAQSLRAGAIVIYPFPRQEFPSPKVARITWTIGVVAKHDKVRDAAERIQALIDVLAAAEIVRWRDGANPTDFAMPDQTSIPGYAIQHVEEHL